MTRLDRLHSLITLMRDGAVHRAEDLAARLGVTPRTIYRDMDRLAASGVPVEGTRGRGYSLAQLTALPPLTLTPSEMEALNLGLAIVAQAADDSLKQAAETLAEKIDAVLPPDRIARADAWSTALRPLADPTRNLTQMPVLRAAIRARQKVRIAYADGHGTPVSRVIRPLHMEYFGRVWTLTAWCEQHEGFQAFRLDLIARTEALPELFADEPGKTLADAAGLS